jgi:glycosyltransferase involved in cell wall biosynthesis
MAKNVILIDFDWVGHVPSYHILWTSALLQLGHKVISYSPCPMDIIDALGKSDNLVTKQLNYRYTSLHSDFFPNVVSSKLHSKINQLKSFKILRSLYFWSYAGSLVKASGINFDRVIFPYLDQKFLAKGLSVKLVDLFFPFFWSGLLVTPNEFRHPSPMFPMDQSRLKIFKSKYFKSLGILDEGVETFVSKCLSPKPVVVFPDVIFEPMGGVNSPDLDGLLKRADGKKVVLLIGEISKRKGIFEFLELSKKAIDLPYVFALIGPLDSKTCFQDDLLKIHSVLKHPAHNQFVRLGRIQNNEEYDSWIKASDYVYAYYPDYPYSSNTVSKAAYYKKPVLVNSGGLLEARVLRHQTGVPTQPSPEKQLRDLLFVNQLSNKGFFKPERFESYYIEQSFNKLKVALSKLLLD